jgi:hypothetical protein
MYHQPGNRKVSHNILKKRRKGIMNKKDDQSQPKRQPEEKKDFEQEKF